MCGKGSQQTTQQSSQTTAPNPQAMAAYQGILNQAQGVAATPYQPFGGELVAGVNPQQYSGIANINAAQGWFPAATAMAYNAAQPVGAAQIQNYMSPYVQNVVGATEAQFANMNAQQQQQVLGNAVQQGALGGNRVGIAQSELANQQQLAQAPVIAGLYNQGYSQALNAALAEQQAALQGAYGVGNLAQAQLTGANAMIGAGTLEQQTAQQQDIANYQQYLNALAYPFQTTQWLAGIGTGVGSQMGGTTTGQATTTAPAPSMFGQLVGGLLGGTALLGGTGAFGKGGYLNFGGQPSGARGGRMNAPVGIENYQAGGGIPQYLYQPAAGGINYPQFGGGYGQGIIPYGSTVNPWQKGVVPSIGITPGRGAPGEARFIPPYEQKQQGMPSMSDMASLGKMINPKTPGAGGGTSDQTAPPSTPGTSGTDGSTAPTGGFDPVVPSDTSVATADPGIANAYAMATPEELGLGATDLGAAGATDLGLGAADLGAAGAADLGLGAADLGVGALADLGGGAAADLLPLLLLAKRGGRVGVANYQAGGPIRLAAADRPDPYDPYEPGGIAGPGRATEGGGGGRWTPWDPPEVERVETPNWERLFPGRHPFERPVEPEYPKTEFQAPPRGPRPAAPEHPTIELELQKTPSGEFVYTPKAAAPKRPFRSRARVLPGLAPRFEGEQSIFPERYQAYGGGVQNFADGGGDQTDDQTPEPTGVATPARDPVMDYIPAIKKFEGYSNNPYWDVRQWTSGYGTRAAGPRERIDRDEAERRLQNEYSSAARIVDTVNPGLDTGSRAALSSLTFNAGAGWTHDRLGAAVRAGDIDTAQRLLPAYSHSAGRFLPGLYARRREEASWMGQENSPYGVAGTQALAFAGPGDAGGDQGGLKTFLSDPDRSRALAYAGGDRPPIPAPTGVVPPTHEGWSWGADNPMWLPLAAMGFGMAASAARPGATFAGSLGEGGLMGIQAVSSQAKLAHEAQKLQIEADHWEKDYRQKADQLAEQERAHRVTETETERAHRAAESKPITVNTMWGTRLAMRDEKSPTGWVWEDGTPLGVNDIDESGRPKDTGPRGPTLKPYTGPGSVSGTPGIVPNRQGGGASNGPEEEPAAQPVQVAQADTQPVQVAQATPQQTSPAASLPFMSTPDVTPRKVPTVPVHAEAPAETAPTAERPFQNVKPSISTMEKAIAMGLHGQAMLDAIPYAFRGSIEAIANYEGGENIFSMMGRAGLSRNAADVLVRAVNDKYDPQWYAMRGTALKNFYAATSPQSPVVQARQARTALGHAGHLAEALEELHKADPAAYAGTIAKFQGMLQAARESGIPVASWLAAHAQGYLSRGTSGPTAAAMAKIESILPLYAGETGKFYSGGQPSLTEMQEIQKPFDPKRSYLEHASALHEQKEAFKAKTKPLEEEWNAIMDAPGLKEYGTKKTWKDWRVLNDTADAASDTIDRIYSDAKAAAGKPATEGKTTAPAPTAIPDAQRAAAEKWLAEHPNPTDPKDIKRAEDIRKRLGR